MAVPTSPQLQRNVSGILKYLHQYLLARFGHANRISPKFRQVEGDLIWHQLEVIRKILTQTKPYAEFRYAVADVLVSFDKDKKRGLFATNDQNCLVSEIVTVIEKVDSKKTGVMPIRDMRGLYKTFEPYLDQILELMQIWIWWDFLDAAELFHFDCQLDRLRMLHQSGLNEKLAAYYKAEMKRDPGKSGPSTLEEVLGFELQRTVEILDDFEQRLQYEESYQEIIGYEGSGVSAVDQRIMQLAQHLRASQMASESGDIDPALREYYGKVLHCEPAAVTPAKAQEFERRYIEQARKELIESLLTVDSSGSHYNFKERQLTQARQSLQSVSIEIHASPAKVA